MKSFTIALLVLVTLSAVTGPRLAPSQEYTDLTPAQQAAIEKYINDHTTKPETPAQRDFTAMMDKVGKLTQKKDYHAAYLLMLEFCKKYPVSSSAKAIAFNVKMWREESLITQDEFDALAKVMNAANPARAEMEIIKPKLEAALDRADTEELKKIAPQLEEIVKKHPGTQSAYDASTVLPMIYSRLGDTEKSKQAGEFFLKTYPPETTDQSGYADRAFDLTLQQIMDIEVRDVKDIAEKRRKLIALVDAQPACSQQGYQAMRLLSMVHLQTGTYLVDGIPSQETMEIFREVIGCAERLLQKNIVCKDTKEYMDLRISVALDYYYKARDREKAFALADELERDYPSSDEGKRMKEIWLNQEKQDEEARKNPTPYVGKARQYLPRSGVYIEKMYNADGTVTYLRTVHPDGTVEEYQPPTPRKRSAVRIVSFIAGNVLILACVIYWIYRKKRDRD